MAAAVLQLRYPAFFDLSCDRCEKFLHTDGRLSRRQGLPVARPAGVPTPCWRCPKIPPSAPAKVREHALEPTERSRKTLRHYRQCRAAGVFPADPIVLRNAGIISEVEQAIEGSRADMMLDLASAIAGALGADLRRT